MHQDAHCPGTTNHAPQKSTVNGASWKKVSMNSTIDIPMVERTGKMASHIGQLNVENIN